MLPDHSRAMSDYPGHSLSTHPLDASHYAADYADPDHPSSLSSDPLSSKAYSFVALPGNSVKKRPRRRYDEIERLYQCNWRDCSKGYGTLNHLNAHIVTQKHGSKRLPSGESIHGLTNSLTHSFPP